MDQSCKHQHPCIPRFQHRRTRHCRFHPPYSRRHTRPMRPTGCRHSRSRPQECPSIRIRKWHQVHCICHKRRLHLHNRLRRHRCHPCRRPLDRNLHTHPTHPPHCLHSHNLPLECQHIRIHRPHQVRCKCRRHRKSQHSRPHRRKCHRHLHRLYSCLRIHRAHPIGFHRSRSRPQVCLSNHIRKFHRDRCKCHRRRWTQHKDLHRRTLHPCRRRLRSPHRKHQWHRHRDRSHCRTQRLPHNCRPNCRCTH